jgi:hypothetical protein
MYPQASTLPNYDVFATPPAPAGPYIPGTGFVPEPYRHMTGLGIAAEIPTGSPALWAIQNLRRPRAQHGLGQMGPGAVTGLGIVWTVLAVGVGGYLSYQAGKAMTPSGSSKKKWGWIGVPAGLLAGPIGLGVMGIVSNRRD